MEELADSARMFLGRSPSVDGAFAVAVVNLVHGLVESLESLLFWVGEK